MRVKGLEQLRYEQRLPFIVTIGDIPVRAVTGRSSSEDHAKTTRHHDQLPYDPRNYCAREPSSPVRVYAPHMSVSRAGQHRLDLSRGGC